MLTLTNALQVEGYTVFRDDEIERRFYLLPDKHTPALAKDEDDQPIISLIVYRRDIDDVPNEAKDDLGGGIMTFTVELPVPEADFKKVRRGLLREVDVDEDESGDETIVDLSVVSFSTGRVTVTVAGEQADDGTVDEGEFVRTVAGEGDVSAIGNNRKAIMVKLTQDGAALFEQTTDLRTQPLNVEYRLTFDHRLDGVTMNVWFEATSSIEVAKIIESETYQSHGYWLHEQGERTRKKVTSLTETMNRSQMLGVTVTPHTSEVDQETLQTLEKFGFDLINKELEKIFNANPPTEDQRTNTDLAFYMSEATNNLNFTLDRKMVLEKLFVPSGTVSGLTREAIVFVDLRTAFFETLTVPVRVNADFEKLPIESVTVTIEYRSVRADGTRERETRSFNFRDPATIGTFRAFANTLDEVVYDWRAEVFYKSSSETMTLSRTAVSDRFLVVGVGDLGILDVELGFGLVNLERFPEARVDLSYRSAALGRTLQTSLRLTGEKPSARWTEVVRETPEEVRYKVSWRNADGTVVEGDEQTAAPGMLRVDAPVRDTMHISVAATGDFKERLAQVLGTFRYADPAHGYVVDHTLTFTSDAQVQAFDVELLDPERRDYDYRYTLIYKSGRVKDVPEEGTLPGEPGFLVIGERFDLEVQLLGALLTYDDRVRMVKVDITCPDAADEDEREASFVFNTGGEMTQNFRVDLRDGGQARYSAEVEYFSAAGEVTRTQLGLISEKKLIIPPLLPEPEPEPTPDGG